MTGRAKLLACLEAALETMPARTREVFLLHRVADLAYPEIADWLGIDADTVEREVAEAILHLGSELSRMEQEEGA